MGGSKSESSSASADAAAAQTALANEQWQFYQDIYAPTELAYAKSARAGLPVPDEVNRLQTTLDRQEAVSQEIKDRNAFRSGVNLQDPRFQPLQNENALVQAAAEAGARTNLRSSLRDLEENRRSAAAQIGQGIPAQTLNENASIGQANVNRFANAVDTQNAILGAAGNMAMAGAGMYGARPQPAPAAAPVSPQYQLALPTASEYRAAQPWNPQQTGLELRMPSPAPSYNPGTGNPWGLSLSLR